MALLANFLGTLQHVPLILWSSRIVHAILLMAVLIVRLAVAIS